jgi:hypothetical protein
MRMLRSCAIAALLVCSATVAAAQPGAATLVTPSGDVVGSTITFTWNSAATATQYQLWIGRPDASLVFDRWFTAEHAGCAGGATCGVSVTPPVNAGAYNWYIRTWAPAGYGPWSALRTFTVRDVTQAWSGLLPNTRRFTVVMNNLAVLDNETGLVWQRNLGNVDVLDENNIMACVAQNTGGRYGWRLPTIAELRSVLDPAQTNPALPLGHPFTVPMPPPTYWTNTRINTVYRVYVSLNDGTVTPTNLNGQNHKLWCVRGGDSTGQ